MAFHRPKIFDLESVNKQLCEDFSIAEFLRGNRIGTYTLKQYLGILNKLESARSDKQRTLASLNNKLQEERLQVFNSFPVSRSSSITNKEQKHISERVQQQLNKSKSFRQQIAQYEKNLELLKRDTKHLIQINESETIQEQKIAKVNIDADYQYRKANDQYSRDIQKSKVLQRMQSDFIKRLRHTDSLEETSLQRMKKHHYDLLTQLKIAETKLKALEKLGATHDDHEEMRLHTVESKYRIVYLQQLMSSLYRLISSEDSLSEITNEQSQLQFTLNLRKSAKMYRLLLQHRHNSVLTLQAVKHGRLQKRLSCATNQPSLNKLTCMIIEAFRQRQQKLSCSEQAYQQGLLRLKTKKTVLHKIDKPEENTQKYRIGTKYIERQMKLNIEMKKIKSQTRKNLMILLEFIRIISEMKVKNLSWNNELGTQLLSAILSHGDSTTQPFQQKLFDNLPAAANILILRIFRDSQPRDSSMNISRRSESVTQLYPVISPSDSYIEEDIELNSKQDSSAKEYQAIDKQKSWFKPRRVQILEEIDNNYNKILKDTSDIEKLYKKNHNELKRKLSRPKVDTRDLVQQQRRFQSAFNGILWDQRSRQQSQLSSQTHLQRGKRGCSSFQGSLCRVRVNTKTQASILIKPSSQKTLPHKRTRTTAFSIVQQ